MGYGWLVYFFLVAIGAAAGFIVGVHFAGYAPGTANEFYLRTARTEEVICLGAVDELRRRTRQGWDPRQIVDGTKAIPLTLMFYPGCNFHWLILSELIKAGADPNAWDQNGNLPIAMAAGDLNFQAVNLLLDKGADINKRSREGRTAIMRLYPGGPNAVRMTKFLIAMGADAKLPDESGKPTWAYAESFINDGHEITKQTSREIVDLLKTEASRPDRR